MTDQELRLIARGHKVNWDGDYEPFIESLHRDFTTGRLYGRGRSRGGAWSAVIDEPMSPYFQKLTEDLEIPPVLPKWDL